MKLALSPERRLAFGANVPEAPGGECWEWSGSRNRDGYGIFTIERRGRLAHRVAYAMAFGPIPVGLCVLHRCDNPPCVNPGHLFLGTQADNVRDCAEKGRRNQTRYPKLSAEMRDEIRHLYAAGDVSQGDLARRFGVSQQVVSREVRRGEGYEPPSLAERGHRRHQLKPAPVRRSP